MNAILVNSPDPVTLIGGGQFNPSELAEALSVAPFLVAADGGANTALNAGHMPRAVIGDMDSLAPGKVPQARLHRISEQETTDFDKALRSIRAPLVLGLGFLGGRMDHQLANFSTLIRRSTTNCVLIGDSDLIFAAPAGQWLELTLDPGTRVSLFPMLPVTGQSEGLQWPIDGIDLAPDGRIGTSNRATTEDVRIWANGPGLLVILPRSARAAALVALLCSRAI